MSTFIRRATLTTLAIGCLSGAWILANAVCMVSLTYAEAVVAVVAMFVSLGCGAGYAYIWEREHGR